MATLKHYPLAIVVFSALRISATLIILIQEKESMSEPTKPSATPPAPPATVKNGKGSSPRNISKKFLSNYEGINWSSGGRIRKEGRKEVKVYS